MKNSFCKKSKSKNGSHPQCISCRNQLYIENQEKTKKYQLNIQDKFLDRM